MQDVVGFIIEKEEDVCMGFGKGLTTGSMWRFPGDSCGTFSAMLSWHITQSVLVAWAVCAF
jgi:hypothetical protein